MLLAVHLGILVRHKHTQFPGPGRAEDNVVGERLWPTYMRQGRRRCSSSPPRCCCAARRHRADQPDLDLSARSGTGRRVSAASQPDWYMGWLDGALRLMPPLEIRAFGYEVPNPFFPGVLLPGVFFTLLYLAPFIEARQDKDHGRAPPPRPAARPAGSHGDRRVGVVFFYLVLLGLGIG